jgi:hypothetical protein
VADGAGARQVTTKVTEANEATPGAADVKPEKGVGRQSVETRVFDYLMYNFLGMLPVLERSRSKTTNCVTQTSVKKKFNRARPFERIFPVELFLVP